MAQFSPVIKYYFLKYVRFSEKELLQKSESKNGEKLTVINAIWKEDATSFKRLIMIQQESDILERIKKLFKIHQQFY